MLEIVMQTRIERMAWRNVVYSQWYNQIKDKEKSEAKYSKKYASLLTDYGAAVARTQHAHRESLCNSKVM